MNSINIDNDLSSTLTSEDTAALHKSIADNVKFATEGDWNSFSKLFSDDVLAMPPGSPPVVGREGLLDMFAGVRILEFESELLQVTGYENIAYGNGEHSWTMLSEGADEPVSESGKWMAIWKKQSNGQWLIAVDMWNSSETPPA